MLPPSPPGAVLSGMIWPPIAGRSLLAESLTSTTLASSSLGHGAWLLTTADGWRLHTPGIFDDIDSAREAVIGWAAAHAKVSSWISERRCVLVSDDDVPGWRLWQVVAPATTLWSRVSSALLKRDAAAIAAAVEDVVAVCDRVEVTWRESPFALPCTLETVGVDGVFVALMPGVERLVEEGADRRGRLVRQLVRLLRSTLGNEAELYLPLLE